MTKKDHLYSELLDACGKSGCPVCHLSLAFTRDYLERTMYEGVNDPGVRAALREARGYCNPHAWLLTEGHGVVLGTAIIQRDILETVVGITDIAPRGRPVRRHAAEILERLQPAGRCPACVHQRQFEDRAIHTLLKYLGDEQLATTLEETSGLCLAHFSRALELVEDSDQLKGLQRFQQEALQGLCEELTELIRKHDYRYADEGFHEEGDSWLRATGIVSGERGIR